MKNEKNTMEKFGRLIHKYTIKDGVEDKAIVPLIYEEKFVEQKVDEENIDLWFEQTTKRLSKEQKTDLKRKWSSMKHLTSTEMNKPENVCVIAEKKNYEAGEKSSA